MIFLDISLAIPQMTTVDSASYNLGAIVLLDLLATRVQGFWKLRYIPLDSIHTLKLLLHPQLPVALGLSN
jgi:hypothetical protein